MSKKVTTVRKKRAAVPPMQVRMKRDEQLLKMYNTGVPVAVISTKLNLSKAQVYNIASRSAAKGAKLTRKYTFNETVNPNKLTMPKILLTAAVLALAIATGAMAFG